MPASAAASAREILTGLHQVMAARGSVQAKLDRVVDLIADKMQSEVCSIYLLRDNKLELFATHGLRKEAVHVTKLRMSEGLVGTIAAEARGGRVRGAGPLRLSGLKLVAGMGTGPAVFHEPRVVVEHTVADDIEAER